MGVHGQCSKQDSASLLLFATKIFRRRAKRHVFVRRSFEGVGIGMKKREIANVSFVNNDWGSRQSSWKDTKSCNFEI